MPRQFQAWQGLANDHTHFRTNPDAYQHFRGALIAVKRVSSAFLR